MDRKFNILYSRKGIVHCAILKSTDKFLQRLNELLADEDVLDIRVYEVVFFDCPTITD